MMNSELKKQVKKFQENSKKGLVYKYLKEYRKEMMEGEKQGFSQELDFTFQTELEEQQERFIQIMNIYKSFDEVIGETGKFKQFLLKNMEGFGENFHVLCQQKFLDSFFGLELTGFQTCPQIVENFSFIFLILLLSLSHKKALTLHLPSISSILETLSHISSFEVQKNLLLSYVVLQDADEKQFVNIFAARFHFKSFLKIFQNTYQEHYSELRVVAQFWLQSLSCVQKHSQTLDQQEAA